MPDALATVIVVAILIVIELILLALLFEPKAVLRAARRLAPWSDGAEAEETR